MSVARLGVPRAGRRAGSSLLEETRSVPAHAAQPARRAVAPHNDTLCLGRRARGTACRASEDGAPLQPCWPPGGLAKPPVFTRRSRPPQCLLTHPRTLPWSRKQVLPLPAHGCGRPRLRPPVTPQLLLACSCPTCRTSSQLAWVVAAAGARLRALLGVRRRGATASTRQRLHHQTCPACCLTRA